MVTGENEIDGIDDGVRQNLIVVGVPADFWDIGGGLPVKKEMRDEFNKATDDCWGKMELCFELFLELIQNIVGVIKLVLMNGVREDFMGMTAAGNKRGDQDIGVDKNLHEIWLKTSSSVTRTPRLAASI